MQDITMDELAKKKPRINCDCGATAGWDMFVRKWYWKKVEGQLEAICPKCKEEHNRKNDE